MTIDLPLLVFGLLAILAGWFIMRGGIMAGAAAATLVVIGLVAAIWSSSIHNWCVPDDMKWGRVPVQQMRFHDGPPSLRDCLALVRLASPAGFMTFQELRQKARSP